MSTSEAGGMELSDYMRVDFVKEILSIDEESGTIRFAIKPDPRRYEKRMVDGKELYCDKFLGFSFDWVELADASKGLVGSPIHHLQPALKNSKVYAAKRKGELYQELESGVYSPPSEGAAQHSDLAGEEGSPITFVSVDICQSTSLRAANASAFDKAYGIFLRELGTVVGQFQGSILKTTGDGFIAFVEHPSINSQSDASVDMGLTFIEVLHSAVNPALESNHLPKFSIRVGADHGTARRIKLSVPATGFESVDISSDALNRCVKIQEASSQDRMTIGRQLYERIHVQWLERSTRVADIGKEIGLAKYEIYSIN